MHRAVTNVARLVLHAAAEDFLIDPARRDELTLAKDGQHETLAQQVETRGLRREAGSVENLLQSQLAVTAGLTQAAAIGERALAEDIHVARLVHRLGGEKHLNLEEVLVDAAHPAGRRVGGDELDLGEKGAELTHRTLEIVG